ncbi:hypothetical protein BKP37_17235 [Anaerobacillus alkalilacustris]|uniref:Uncharacterized protein n=1 Tax=Anaerobacillus alkalilacustris TaxID=393763 RepID=A0A1S2LH28_9BACI|nr:hypothetical protein [Anaerobacillus alkalilacustris]OIJ10805.1 hypothetical protein BKP37_17235 [Anaerobacillus alkalilacustris]
MKFETLTHIILGTTLTFFIVLTIYFLLRLLFAKKEKKDTFTVHFRRTGVITIVLFIVYMSWIFIKKTFL